MAAGQMSVNAPYVFFCLKNEVLEARLGRDRLFFSPITIFFFYIIQKPSFRTVFLMPDVYVLNVKQDYKIRLTTSGRHVSYFLRLY